MAETSNPAELHEYDGAWPVRAAASLADIRERLADLPGASDAAFEHIGSTSVPGLAAKPYLDLQIGILPLPEDREVAARLADLGFERALGSRPDSPGVYRDVPRGSERVPDAVWEKAIFFDAEERIILHVRRSDSPWARYTVWFRDWLRAHPEQRDRYARMKRELSVQFVGAPDYDDYTRAKTAFFDEVQAEFESWARSRPPAGEPRISA